MREMIPHDTVHTTTLPCVMFDMCKCPQSYINIDCVYRSTHTTDQIRLVRLYNLKHLSDLFIKQKHRRFVQQGSLWWPGDLRPLLVVNLPRKSPFHEKWIDIDQWVQVQTPHCKKKKISFVHFLDFYFFFINIHSKKNLLSCWTFFPT